MLPQPHRRARAHLFVLALYTVAALALTWPLARHLPTHVPGDGVDDPALAWNLWWIMERIVHQGSLRIFDVDWMFHPIGINLAFYTLTPLSGLLSIPLQAAFGLVVASNLLLLSSFVLSGYGAYLLTCTVLSPLLPSSERGQNSDRIKVLRVAAFVAGFLYAFAAPRLFYAALGQFNIASSQWIPFCALYLVLLARARTLRGALRAGALAGLFLLLQAWAELTYASFLLIFCAIAALFAFAGIVQGRQKVAHVVAGYGAAALLFVAGMAPYLAAMLPDLRAEGDFFASGGGFADLFSADLAGLLVPTRMHPVLGDWVASLPFPGDVGQQLFIGITLLLLALVGMAWLWRRARVTALFWGGASLLFWLLALGPTVRWMGTDTGIPAPFALVSLLPFFNGNRYPSRYGVMLLLCLGVLAAAGVLAIALRLHARAPKRSPRVLFGATVGVSALVLALFLGEHVAIPLPLSDFRIPSLYSTLARAPGDLAVLELPTGWRNGARVLGKSDVLIMMQQWYQTAHGKRRLGGNTSRNPQQKFQFFTEHPLLGDLIALMNADRDYLEPALDAELDALIARHAPNAAQELANLGVGWVTVHVEQAPAQLLAFVERALPLTLVEEWQGADWLGQPATIRLYQVEPPAPATIRTIDLAAPEGARYLANGWSALTDGALRFATRANPELVVPVAAGDMLHFSGTGEATILLNGQHLAYTAGDDFAIVAPAALAAPPVDRITIEFAGRGAPVTTLAHAPLPIGATGVELAAGATLVVRSAAEDVGDFAQIWLNGVDVAVNTRGYALAALDANGNLLDAQTFDTHGSAQASAEMAAWIAALPAGTIVAGAVADEASLNLSQEAFDALASLGVQMDLRGRFRWSHAFIGVAGARPRSALEEGTLLRPANMWLGAAVDGARIYGALAEFTIETPIE